MMPVRLRGRFFHALFALLLGVATAVEAAVVVAATAGSCTIPPEA